MITVTALVSWRGLPRMASDDPVTTGQDSGGERVALSRVVLLGTIAFLAFFAEGAILDWIAIYVVRMVEATESTGALVYAVFASAMTLGRLIGDRAKLRLGAVRLCRVAVKYETRRVGRHFLPLIVRFCCQWGGPLSGAFHDPINGD